MPYYCRIIAVLLLVSFTSCASAPYTVNGVLVTGGSQPPRLRLLQAGSAQRPSSQQTPQQPQQTAAPPYWTGDGGKGKSITILPPKGSGLAENQAYLPDFVANELVSNFNTFSAMTLFDRVNNQKQYEELLSGIYADDDKAGLDLGHLASTDLMLLGSITKTSTGYALQLTVNRNRDKTTVAAYSGTVSIAELDNLTGIRRASLDLLAKMSVQLTAQARAELTKAPTTDQLSALAAMAQGIIAQRQNNTSVAALTYFMQAAAFDASLAEAVSRTNVLSANISTGNIGANVRNDFAWSDSWEAKLKETETLMNDMLQNTVPQRSVWYSPNVQEVESARDRTTRTTEFRTEAALHTHAALPVSVRRTVQAVYDGLQTTKRAQAWKFDGWPQQGRTNVNPFNRTWGGTIPVAFELLNEQGKVIGRQTVEMASRYSFNGTKLSGPETAFATVRFTGVKADDITDKLSIRIASINGKAPEEAGIARIGPMPAEQMAANKKFTVYNGAIWPSSNDRNLGTVVIPAEIWGERVTAIANGAFENRGITGVTIPNSVTTIEASAFANNRLESVTIFEGVTTIGDKAFADNHWTTTVYGSNGSYTEHHGLKRVTISDSVTYIGDEAFSSHWTITSYASNGSSYTSHYWLPTEVTIGANVSIGKNAIGAFFEVFYDKGGRQAGIYKRDGTKDYNKWERFDNRDSLVQTVTSRNKRMSVFIVTGVVLLGVTCYTLGIWAWITDD